MGEGNLDCLLSHSLFLSSSFSYSFILCLIFLVFVYSALSLSLSLSLSLIYNLPSSISPSQICFSPHFQHATHTHTLCTHHHHHHHLLLSLNIQQFHLNHPLNLPPQPFTSPVYKVRQVQFPSLSLAAQTHL